MRRSPLQSMSDARRRKERELAKSKLFVLERSGGYCEARFSDDCTGVGVHVHHVKPRSAGGGHDTDNLLHCCMFCHERIHAHPVEAKRARLLKGMGW